MHVLKREYHREQKALDLKCLLHYNVFFIFSPFKSTRFSPRVFLIYIQNFSLSKADVKSVSFLFCTRASQISI